jgi:hypothetical protein
MFDHLNRISAEQTAKGLAVRFCREVFLFDGTSVYKWQALKPIVLRLNADLEETHDALEYAVGRRRRDVFGDPAVNLMLLEAGRAVFADADISLPRRAPEI